MSKATESQLNTLHNQLAATLTTMVTVQTVAKVSEDGSETTEVIQPSPAALAVAAKFLKDNSIFSSPENDDEMKALGDALADRRNKRRVDKQDLQEAMGAIGRELLQ